MGQMYSATYTSTGLLDAVGDLIEIFPASQNPICVHKIEIGQTLLEQDVEASMAQLDIRRDTAGGTADSLTPRPLLPGTETCDAVVKYNHSVPAAGSETILINAAWNVQAGYLYLPTPEERIWFTSAAGMVVRNLKIITETTLTVVIVFEEFKMI
jgi:hypothetical protein